MTWWLILTVAGTSVLAGHPWAGSKEDCEKLLAIYTQETPKGRAYEGFCVDHEPRFVLPDEYDRLKRSHP